MKNKLTLSESIRENIEDLGAVQDVSKTLKKFDQLQVDEAFDKWLAKNWKRKKMVDYSMTANMASSFDAGVAYGRANPLKKKEALK